MSHVLSAVAWPYTNGPRHIGHVAGFGVPSDVFSRYMRMAGHDVLMVSGTDEHGTPILVLAEEEGLDAAGARRQVQRRHRPGPRRPRPVLRPLHPHDDAQPLRRRAGDVPPGPRQRLHDRADDPRRDQPVDGPHPARPLHRGHLPDLRLPRGARRPVRQLRQPARRRRADQPAQQDQRRDAGVHRDAALLPRPAGARRRARRVARRPRGLGHVAPQRHQVQQEPPQGRAPARDDARHRLGHPDPARGLGGQPDQAPLRLVRRRHRLPLGLDRVGAPHRRRRSAGASGGTTRRPCPTTSRARTTSPSTARSGRPSCSATPGRGDKGGEPGEYGVLNLPDRGRGVRVHDARGQAVLDARASTSSTCRTSSRATAPTRSATSSAPPARRTRTPTSAGPSSSSATTASSSPAGATSSTARPR